MDSSSSSDEDDTSLFKRLKKSSCKSSSQAKPSTAGDGLAALSQLDKLFKKNLQSMNKDGDGEGSSKANGDRKKSASIGDRHSRTSQDSNGDQHDMAFDDYSDDDNAGQDVSKYLSDDSDNDSSKKTSTKQKSKGESQKKEVPQRREFALPLKDTSFRRETQKKDTSKFSDLREKRKQMISGQKQNGMEEYGITSAHESVASSGKDILEMCFPILSSDGKSDIGKLKKIEKIVPRKGIVSKIRGRGSIDYLTDNIMVVQKADNSDELEKKASDDATGLKIVFPICQRDADGLEDISEAYWRAMVRHTLPKLFKNFDHRSKDLQDKRVKPLGSYSCSYCEKGFNSYGFYIVHLNEHLNLSSGGKSKNFPWLCPFCKTVLDTCWEFMSHLDNAGHVDFEPYKCGHKDCVFTCETLEVFDEHDTTSHGKDTMADVLTPADINKQDTDEDNAPITTEFKITSSNDGKPLTKSVIHTEVVNKSDPRTDGILRSKMFNQLCKMRLSALNAGSRADDLVCDICGTSNNCYGDYLFHMDRHDIANVPKRCVFCKHQHDQMDGILQHYTTVHAKAFPAPPYKCAKCPATFYNQRSRIDHWMGCCKQPSVRASDKVVFVVTANLITDMPEEFVCKTCQHKTNCYGDLFLHFWKHYEDEDRVPAVVKCPICQFEAATMMALIWHFLSHAKEERPFKCPYFDRCGIGFNSIKMRDTHTKVCERDQISFQYNCMLQY